MISLIGAVRRPLYNYISGRFTKHFTKLHNKIVNFYPFSFNCSAPQYAYTKGTIFSNCNKEEYKVDLVELFAYYFILHIDLGMVEALFVAHKKMNLFNNLINRHHTYMPHQRTTTTNFNYTPQQINPSRSEYIAQIS